MTDDRPVAVFDLDGTLVRRDTFLPFVFGYGWRRRRPGTMLIPIDLALYGSGVLPAGVAKGRVLRRVLRGETPAEVERAAEAFAEQWVPARLVPATAGRLEHHAGAGHRLILLTASPVAYAAAIARRLGIPEVIGTEVGFDGGRCTGAIVGENCRGPAKLARLQEYLGTEISPAGSFAYGDSRHDLPVLQWVAHGFLLRRGRFEPMPATTRRVAP